MTDVLEAKLVKRSGVGRNRKWAIADSDCGGRGVFATCDIASGDFVFADLPILTGPKLLSCGLVACTSCSDNSRPLRKCSKNCHLPFCCEKCENEETHKKECYFLSSLNLREEEWSPYIFRALTLIRSLLMTDDDKEVVEHLHANRGKQVDIQVSSLLSLMGNTLDEKDISWVRHCCGVLDGTAFEIELEDSTNTIKGLFPLSAMMNHKCVPNTRHFYTDRADGYRMLVVASQFISRGSQIFTSYCPLLWATNLRRKFLLHTKHFQCTCERCQDPSVYIVIGSMTPSGKHCQHYFHRSLAPGVHVPLPGRGQPKLESNEPQQSSLNQRRLVRVGKEFGTNLQAVKCSCGCIMLPQDPLNFNTEWKCESCRELRSAKRNMTIQKSLRNSNELEWNNYYPECNYLLMQMKINRVFMKTSRGKSLEDLTDNDLITVLLDCTVILKRIVQLKLGNTRFKGRLCSRLEKVSKEIERRGVLTEKAEMEDFLECGQAIETQDKLARAKFL